MDSALETVRFSFEVRLGLVFVVQIASLSAVSVICVLSLVLYYAILSGKSGTDYRPFAHPIALQFISLLCFDFIQSMGSILHIPWIANAMVTEGLTCTIQGVLKQVGDVGVALTTSIIAITTFVVLAFNIEVRPLYSKLLLLATYVMVAVLVGSGFALGARDNRTSLYGDTGYWCWITDEFDEERIVLEYLWLWIAALTTLISYVGMALIIRGNLVFSRKGLHFQVRSKHSVKHGRSPQHNALVWQMLFYPAIYLTCVIPISICRFMSFNGQEVPYQATFFASFLFSGSGFFNSLLFAFTRPSLSFNAAAKRSPHSAGLASVESKWSYDNA